MISCYSGNEIGNEGAKSIAAMLEKNETVTNINLSSEWIDYFFQMYGELTMNCRLDNNVGIDGAKSIAAALENNKTVTCIDLSCKKKVS